MSVLLGLEGAGCDEAFASLADLFLFARGEALEHLLDGDRLRFGGGG